MPLEITGFQAFRANIDKFVAKTGLRGTTVLRKIALDGFAGVLKKSPVDKGRFRGNWNVAINAVDLSVTGDAGKASGMQAHDPPGGTERSYSATKLLKVEWEDEINITNNLPYARPLEFGHSSQAPGAHAILGRTFEELKSSLAAALRAVEKEVP